MIHCRGFVLLLASTALMPAVWFLLYGSYHGETMVIHADRGGWAWGYLRGEGAASPGDELVERAVDLTDQLKIEHSPSEHEEEKLVNPHDYRLVLDEPTACMDVESGLTRRPVFLLVLVASSHENFVRRRLVRETWGSTREIDGRRIVTLFLLARSGDPFLEARVEAESASHHDLLMEDFQDAYKNLTLKTLMAMKWAGTHCPHAAYVMKTDDDMFVSYRNLLSYLAASRLPSTDLALGLVLAGQSPVRDPKNKWYTPPDVYPGDVYPPWLSGGGFVLSGDLPGRIYAASLRIASFHLEDVYIGICLASLGIRPTSSRRFNNMHLPYSYCRFRSVITSHHVGSAELRKIWMDEHSQKQCWSWT